MREKMNKVADDILKEALSENDTREYRRIVSCLSLAEDAWEVIEDREGLEELGEGLHNILSYFRNKLEDEGIEIPYSEATHPFDNPKLDYLFGGK